MFEFSFVSNITFTRTCASSYVIEGMKMGWNQCPSFINWEFLINPKAVCMCLIRALGASFDIIPGCLHSAHLVWNCSVYRFHNCLAYRWLLDCAIGSVLYIAFLPKDAKFILFL